jgi:hypothetical protein
VTTETFFALSSVATVVATPSPYGLPSSSTNTFFDPVRANQSAPWLPSTLSFGMMRCQQL